MKQGDKMAYRNSLFREIKVLPSKEQVRELLGMMYVVGTGTHMFSKVDETNKKIVVCDRDTNNAINTFNIHHPIIPYFQTMPCDYEKALEYREAGASIQNIKTGGYYYKEDGGQLDKNGVYRVAHWIGLKNGAYCNTLKELCTITIETLKASIFQREFFELLLTVK